MRCTRTFGAWRACWPDCATSRLASPRADEVRAALVFVSDGSVALDVDELRQWFGLTTAEARLLQLLARGMRLQGCASALGVGIATVRTHLSAILAKTGATTQAQLLAMVLAMPQRYESSSQR